MNFGWRARWVLFLQTRSIEAYREELKRVREERKETVKRYYKSVAEEYEDPETAIFQFHNRVWDYDYQLVNEALRECREPP